MLLATVMTVFRRISFCRMLAASVLVRIVRKAKNGIPRAYSVRHTDVTAVDSSENAPRWKIRLTMGCAYSANMTTSGIEV